MSDNINNITNAAVDEASKQMDALLKKAVKDISSGVGGAVVDGVQATLSVDEKKARGVQAASKVSSGPRSVTQQHANQAARVRSSSKVPETIGIEDDKIYQVIDIENVYDGSNSNSKRGSKAVTYARSVYDKSGAQFGETEYYYVDYDGAKKIKGKISETAELIYRMVTNIDGLEGDGASAQSVRDEIFGQGTSKDAILALNREEVKAYIQKVIDSAKKKAKGKAKTSSVTSSFTGSTFTATSSEHIKFKSIEEIRRQVTDRRAVTYSVNKGHDVPIILRNSMKELENAADSVIEDYIVSQGLDVRDVRDILPERIRYAYGLTAGVLSSLFGSVNTQSHNAAADVTAESQAFLAMDKEPELVVKILEEELDLAAKEFTKQHKGRVFYDASGRIASENADWVRGWFLKRADIIRNKVDGEGASNLTGEAGDQALIKSAEAKIKSFGKVSGYKEFVGTLQDKRGSLEYFGQQGLAKRLEVNLQGIPKDKQGKSKADMYVGDTAGSLFASLFQAAQENGYVIYYEKVADSDDVEKYQFYIAPKEEYSEDNIEGFKSNAITFSWDAPDKFGRLNGSNVDSTSRIMLNGDGKYTDQNTWGLAKNIDVIKRQMALKEGEKGKKSVSDINAHLSAQSQDIRQAVPRQYDGTVDYDDVNHENYGLNPADASAEEIRRADALMNWSATLSKFFEKTENYHARKKASEIMGEDKVFAPWEVPQGVFNLLSRYLTQRTKNPQNWRESIEKSKDEQLKQFINSPEFNELFLMIDKHFALGGGYYIDSLSSGSVRSGKGLMTIEADVPYTDILPMQSISSENIQKGKAHSTNKKILSKEELLSSGIWKESSLRENDGENTTGLVTTTMALPLSVLQKAIEAQYGTDGYRVGVSEEILFGDTDFAESAKYFGNVHRKQIDQDSISQDLLQHLGVSKDWLEDIASGSVFDPSKIKEVEDELSISDDITIPPNSIITSLTKTENGIEISFLTKEEMEMARKLVDTGTNQRHEFVHLEQQSIIEAINADDSLRPEEKSQLIEAIKNEGVHTFTMEAPLSRSSSARVGGSFNQPFWEYLINRIKSKEQFQEIAKKHKSFGARYSWDDSKGGVVSNLHLDRKTGKIATSDGKALYETDEFWTDVDDKLQKAIDKDLEAKGKSSKDLSKEDFRKLLINYRAAYMANVVDSIDGEQVGFGSLYTDVAKEVLGEGSALIGRLKDSAPNATPVAEYQEMAGLGEKDVGESKVRVSTRAKEVILKRLNLLKMSDKITQEEIDKIMGDVWKFYGGTQRDQNVYNHTISAVLGKSIDDISGTNIVPVFDLVFGDGDGKLQDGSELTSSQIDISEAVMDNPTGQEISVEEYKNSVLGFIRQQVEASGHILGNNAQVKLSFAGLGQETIAALNNAGFYDGQILAVDEMEKVTEKTKKVSIKGNDRTTLKFLRGARNIVNNESSEKEYGNGHAGDYYRSELGKRTKSGGDLFKHSAARLAPASGNLKVLPLEESGLGDGPSYGIISFEGAHELLKMGKGAKTSDVVDAYDAIVREIENDEEIKKRIKPQLLKIKQEKAKRRNYSKLVDKYIKALQAQNKALPAFFLRNPVIHQANMLAGLKINTPESGQGSNVLFLPQIVAELLNADFDGDTVQVLFNLANENIAVFNKIMQQMIASQEMTKEQLAKADKAKEEADKAKGQTSAQTYGNNMIKEMEALTNPNVGAGFTSSTRLGQFHLGMGSFKNTRTQDLLEAHRDMSGADITQLVKDIVFRDLASEIVEQQGISAKKTLEQILINPDEAWDSDTLEKLEDAIFNYTGSDEHNALLERYGVKFTENSKMLFSMNDINAVFGDRAKEILSGTGIFNQTALENGIYELTSDGLKELLYHTADVEKDSHGKNYLSYKQRLEEYNARINQGQIAKPQGGPEIKDDNQSNRTSDGSDTDNNNGINVGGNGSITIKEPSKVIIEAKGEIHINGTTNATNTSNTTDSSIGQIGAQKNNVEPIIYNEEDAKNFVKETREKNKSWVVGKAENAVGYEQNHERDLTVGGKPFGNYSVTELLGQFKEINPFDQDKLNRAAAKGTYGHAVLEALGNSGVDSIEELKDEDKEALKKAQIALENALGYKATPQLIESIQKQALAIRKKEQELGVNADIQREKTYGGKFEDADTGITGQADFVGWGRNEGGDFSNLVVRDYKFSNDDSVETLAQRIAQASVYMFMEEEEIAADLVEAKKELERIEKQGGDTSEAQATVDALIQKQKALGNEDNRMVQILRGYEKNGEQFVDVVEAKAMSREAVLELLEIAQEEKVLNDIIAKLEYKPNLSDDDKARLAEAKGKLQAIRTQRPKISTSAIFEDIGGFDSINFGTTYKGNPKKTINSYIKNYKDQLKLQEQIQRAEINAQSKSGEELQASQQYILAMEKRLNQLKQEAPILDENAMTINGMKINEEQLLYIKQKISAANADHLVKEKQITAQQKKQQGFLDKLMGGLKQQMVGFIDTSLAYQAIGMVRSNIRELINTTKELDSALVDIQIATGQTRAETRELMLTYTDLAKEMGRTTQSVAQASNDWLRAGYEGEEAAKLTKASMMLSTLGMIEATDATTYLISTLKGWKISANEVIGVVDKLTAVDMAAAISAGDLALAMSRANNSARLAGSDMNQFIGYVTTVADVTQKSAESVGESFKTIYSRFGNVKANKYAATTADMDSADYNSDEFENLNDIETVLTKQGIKLRETAGTWRDIDDVISEIAEKWQTWDKTTQNAVATVVAGTRQRENVITLFENWDDVAKYAEIAENAYGTATAKMSAYTDSIEASQYRLTTAVEKWALKLNQSDVIKGFYNVLGFAIENMDALIASVGGLLIALNGTAIITTFYSGLSKLGLKLMEIGAITPSAQNGWRVGDIQREQSKKSAFGNIVTAYSQKIEQDYNNVLTTYMGTLEQANRNTAIQIDTQMQLLDVSDQRILGEQMLLALDKSKQALGFKELTEDGKQIVSQIILNTSNKELIEANGILTKQKLEQIASGQQVELSDEELAQMQKLYANYIKSQMEQGGQVYTTMGTYYAGAEQRQQDIKNQAKQSVIIGASSIAGGMLGVVGGGAIGEQIGEELGDSGAGQTIGMVLGGSIGSWAAKTVGPKIIDGLGFLSKKAVTSLGAKIVPLATKLGGLFGGKIAASAGPAIAAGAGKVAAVASAAAPWAAAAVIAGGVVFALYKNTINKQLKKMSEEFEEQAAAYSAKKGSDIDATKLDMLAKGVDNLGRNVSLTEEEYQEFLELNNSLAELYPELIIRTDEAGNHFVGMGNSIAGVTEKVKELIAQQQLIADKKMFEETGGFAGFGKTTLAKENLEAAQNSVNTNFLNNRKLFDDNNYSYLVSKVQSKDFKEVLNRAGVTMDDAVFAMKVLSDEIYVPNDNRGTYEETYAKIKRAYDTLYEEEQNKINAVTNEMADEMDIAVRQIYRNEFNNMTDEESAYWQRIRGNISAFDENNNKLSDEVFYGNTKNVFGMYNDAFLTDEKGQDFLNIAMKDVTDYESVGDYIADRAKLTKYLKDTFGENGFDENEMSILIGLGFKVEDGDVVDDNNIMNKLSDLGIEYATHGNDDQITQFKLKQLKPEDAKKAFELIKSGAIEATGSMDTLIRLLYADRGMPASVESAEAYTKEMLVLLSGLEGEVQDFFSGDNWQTENVDEIFASYPTSLRNAIKEAQEGLKEGEDDLDSYLETISNLTAGKMTEILGQLAEVEINSVFGEEFLGDIEGHINTLSELKSALSEVANTYNALGNAQKEQNRYGKLSVQTVVDLLNSNINYAQVLEFTTDAENGKVTSCKLSADAQKIMTNIQLEATRVSLQAAMAEEAQTIALNNQRLSALNATSGYINLEGETENLIEVNEASLTVWGRIGAFIQGVGAAITALINLDFDKVGEAYDVAYNAAIESTGALSEVDWEKRYKGLTNEQVQDEINKLTKSNIEAKERYDTYKYTYDQLGQAIESGEYGFLGEDFGLDLDFEDAMTELEKLEAALENINKEWEAMQVYSKELGRELKPTEYFNKMYANLKSQETLLKNQLAGNSLEESERYEAQNKLQQVQVQIANLDEEIVNDRIALLETEGEVSNELIRQYELLLQASDTEEDRIKYAQQLNDKLKEQRQLVMDTYEFQQDMLDTQLKYYDSSPDSDEYKSLMKNKIATYGEAMKQALVNMQKDWDVAFEAALYEYKTAIDKNGNRLYTDAEATLMATNDANNSKDVRDDYKEYIEAYEAIGEAEMKIFDDKVDAIEREITRIEDAAPKKWTSIAQIKKHYEDLDGYYNNVLNTATATLKDVENLTDEQIEEIVDKANEATKQIHENAIAKYEDIIEYQESVYNALTNEVQRYIDDLEKQKEIIEETYDKELEKLQDKEDAIARTNKLIELQNNLLNAQKEKERVYREGIGWVYESNREKVRTAENELNNFYRQDNIDDLNNAKDAELKNIDDRIKNWEDYLAMLNEKYNEYALLEEKRLLKELLNVETDAEIKAAIVADMTKFTTEIGLNYETFLANQSAFYLSYNSTFSSFLTEYSNNLATLAELKSKELSLLSAGNYSSVNLSSSFGGSNSGGYYTGSDADLMNKYGIVASWGWTNTDYLDSWIQGEGYENGSISKNSDGTYTVYDGKQNYMGTINPDGSITSNAGDLGENYLNNAKKFVQTNDPNYGSNKTSGGGSGSKNNSWSGMVDSAKQNASSGEISGLTSSTSNNSNKTTTSNSGSSTKVVDDSVVNAVIRGNYGNGAARKEALTAAGYDASAVQKAVNERLKGHADGILSGPVTYTGLTMLHGTSSEPEYVLNNDQAYNLLRYMATKKMPEFEVAGSNSSGVQYIVEGDIVLEGVDNPQEFWGEVTKAMGNRWNVTKNR